MHPSFLYRLYANIFLRSLDFDRLSSEQRDMTILNIKKHTHIFFLMLLTFPFTYWVIHAHYIDQIDTVITTLLGSLFISGTAWFAISFGAIPEKFLDFALRITFHLFMAFAISLTAVLAVGVVAAPLLSPVFVLVFFTLYIASVMYDVVDALKIGIDEAVLEHARVGRTYFMRELKKE